MLTSGTPGIDIPVALITVLEFRCGSLQMLPEVAVQALDAAQNVDCSISDFAAIVERDVKLATDMLSIANSVTINGGKPISSLHQAIVRLGFRQCRNLILSSGLAALMNNVPVQQEAVRKTLWEHGFLTAMISLHLNRALHIGFQGEEFTAGLLHDFGRTLFAICLPDKFPQFDQLNFDEDDSSLELESEMTGATHCQLGAWFANKNQLPVPLIDAVLFHHVPQAAHRNRQLVALTAAADHMANHIQRTATVEGYEPIENEAVRVLELSGVPFSVDHFSHVCNTVLDHAHRDYMALVSTQN